ncbi:sialidase family protein [Algoriphagus halophytocola]|uniref:Glycoside hydrolase n=1 Tax=Algoriphagus halophytocola TaxID=2991499 RepID=A0ABY6MG99_9BACT|nr:MULTISPECIES: sialidase family protein [unclassified Algoriphagus]UZD22838.1 glycoside hydrolase [Algoriphagus sp. TR-M5]WBL44105.1 sialidase family protein [Algoriphagus sp. TR-M9]
MKRNQFRSIAFAFLGVLLQCYTAVAQQNKYIEHQVVFQENGKYGGWPANHGIWVWGDEILVGFVQASFNKDEKGLHTYDPKTAENYYARSRDGGETWSLQDAYSLGQTAWGHDNNISDSKAAKPEVLKEPMPDFTSADFLLTFLRHNNDDGPSHFYYSNNKGATWDGPFVFPNMGTAGIANRTDYHVESSTTLTAFVTTAKSNSKEGRVAFVRTTDGGLNWELVSWVTPEHGGFDIMPSSIRLDENTYLTTIRTRLENGQNLISSYLSKNKGNSWQRLVDPAPDTGQGGSPPALVQLDDGRLALGYIHRSVFGSRVHVRFSEDQGRTWGNEIILRSGDGANRDVGYPRMVQRADGKLVMIYYWNHANSAEEKPYRYIAATIFDPEEWK